MKTNKATTLLPAKFEKTIVPKPTQREILRATAIAMANETKQQAEKEIAALKVEHAAIEEKIKTLVQQEIAQGRFTMTCCSSWIGEITLQVAAAEPLIKMLGNKIEAMQQASRKIKHSSVIYEQLIEAKKALVPSAVTAMLADEEIMAVLLRQGTNLLNKALAMKPSLKA